MRSILMVALLMFSCISARPMRSDHIFQHQCAFTRNIAQLIAHIYSKGYKCTLGEVYRTHEQALRNAQLHIGVVNSNHCYRLAVDLNLFSPTGEYLHDGKEYKQFGEYWEKLDPFNEWGGRFKDSKGRIIGDANHFEMD